MFSCDFVDLRYADDTTLMAESEEELKSLLMTVKVDPGSLSSANSSYTLTVDAQRCLLMKSCSEVGNSRGRVQAPDCPLPALQRHS